MQLQESGEMYLETILILSRQKPAVRAIDIVEYMQFSKPSVSRAMGLLKNGGFITVEKDGHIRLTDTGRGGAEKNYKRHTVVTKDLPTPGVPEDIAAADGWKKGRHKSHAAFCALQSHIHAHEQS